MNDEKLSIRHRKSLSRLELESVAGKSLLDLCKFITEDGGLSDDDIYAVRNWVRENSASVISATEYLKEYFEQIKDDEFITNEKRTELYKVIEAVLPPEERKQARESRKHSEQLKKQAKKERDEFYKQEVRKQKKDERERNRVIDDYDFQIAGFSFEGRQSIIKKYAGEDDKVLLIREPHNKHDRNAIIIQLINGMQIGYVPRDLAKDLAKQLDRGCKYRAWISIILTNHRKESIPVVVIKIHEPNANLEEAEVTRRLANAENTTAKTGCLSSLFLIACISICLILLISYFLIEL